MYLRGAGYGSGCWVLLADVAFHWKGFVNTMMKIQVPKVEHFLTG
jgi:hypothetical protein